MDLGRFNFRESLKHQADARKFGSSAPGSRVSSTGENHPVWFTRLWTTNARI